MAKMQIIHFKLVFKKGRLKLFLNKKEVKRKTDYSISFFIKNRTLEQFQKSLEND